MNAPDKDPSLTLTVGQCIIVGRCIGVRRVGELYIHLVTLPAPDTYSHPSTVEIGSPNRIADRDEEVRVKCRVHGFARQYKAMDKDTGELRVIRTADVRLTAV